MSWCLLDHSNEVSYGLGIYRDVILLLVQWLTWLAHALTSVFSCYLLWCEIHPLHCEKA